MQTADQRETDREEKLQQKAALYERLQNGQGLASSAASDFLVDFEKLAEQQLSNTAIAEPSGQPPPNYDPVHFRQQGLLQVRFCLSMSRVCGMWTSALARGSPLPF